MKSSATPSDTTTVSFHQWLQTLNWKDLQDSMEFQLSPQELELLREMVQLQPPLCTPIHPRAIPYRPASAAGKSYSDSTRFDDRRFSNPRLFQWIPRISTSLEDKEAELLAMLSSGTKKPQQRSNNKKQARRTAAFSCDVIAKQFRQLDGLCVGSTAEQQRADNELLTRTVLRGDACRVCFSSSSNSTADTRELLRVASRGNFGSVPVESGTVLPLWFDPQDRWFTLSLYLASRFEVALWNAFSRDKQPATVTDVNPFQQVPDSSLCSMYATAVGQTVKDILKEEHTSLMACQCHIRDGFVWNILVENGGILPNVRTAGRLLVEDLWSCPIVELGSKSEILRRTLRDRMQLLIADHVEKSLLHDLDCVSDDTSIMNNTTRQQSRKPNRKKRKKGRSKKKNSAGRQQAVSGDGISSTIGVGYGIENVSSSGSEHEKGNVKISSITKQKQRLDERGGIIVYPNNNTSTRDRNRNIVLALSILDDVVTKVFLRVGLAEENDLKTSNRTDERSVLPENESCDEPFRVIDSGGRTGGCPAPKASKGTTVLVRPCRAKSPSVPRPPSAKDIEKNRAAVPVSQLMPSGPSKQVENQPQWKVDDHELFPSIRESEYATSSGISQFPQFTPQQAFEADNSATLRTSNLEGLSSGYNALAPGFFHRPDTVGAPSWDMPGFPAIDGWGRFRGFVSRDESILSEFFHSQEQAGNNNDEIMASSTAASIASSSGKEDDEDDEVAKESDTIHVAFSVDVPECKKDSTTDQVDVCASLDSPQPETPPSESAAEQMSPDPTLDKIEAVSCFQTPSPPSTPPPTLSPILVSLSDLSEMRRESLGSLEIPSSPPRPSEQTQSVPASPQRPPQLVSSLSRDNLRAPAKTENGIGRRKDLPSGSDLSFSYKAAATRPARSRDDHDIKGKMLPRRSTDALSTYRNVLVRPGITSRDDNDIKPHARETPPRFSSYRSVAARTALTPAVPFANLRVQSKKPFNNLHFETMMTGKQKEENLSTRSETALDGEDYQNWHELRPSHTNEEDNNTVTKDGSTTITSALSQREPEEMLQLKEERNAYRDMCLTLGAEVSKLRNLLAAQTNAALYPTVEFPPGHGHHPFRSKGFDPESVNHPYHIAPRARTLAAMSDAGYRGDHESLASEDDFAAKLLTRESSQQLSSGVTVAESDVSFDRNSGHNLAQIPTGFLQPVRDLHDVVSLNGMQSRLARDVFQFLETTNAQLRKQDAKRQKAVLRMTRLVKTVWPRAQVKLYGSHVTGLCLPSSDLDFIVCLPAVHKNAVADAPGALEGRNAVNETSQRLLARRLKSESWIDPRSMKLIEKTVVPVIKVATKDTRAKTLQLDISFDAPNHHGLEAVHMVTQIIDELPMIRPLVIVLKQFLIDRGLLTAYTGGLSSYCLFLMVARYLQEQTMMGDCGSLLMGFLDFYGNCFDPRSTGISVLYRQYFARPNYAAAQNQTRLWGSIVHAQAKASPVVGNAPYVRRNSFNDKGSASSGLGGRPTMARPPTFHSPAPPAPVYNSTDVPPDVGLDQNSFDHGMPYTFDPLFVEDPLAEGNNVGRNAFRIVQVQRCFSDAHRALSSALEWDMHSSGEMQDVNEFPLLKCLLQSEDVVFDL